MRTLLRYLVSEFAKIFALCFFGFVFLYVLVDLVERANQIVKYKATGYEVSLYVLYSLPQICLQMLPISILLGTILTLAIFSRRNELIAIRAAGINMRIFNIPFLVAGLLASLVIFWLQENVAPVGNQKASDVWKYEIREKERKIKTSQENLWLLVSDGIVRIGLYQIEERLMRDISFYRITDDTLIERVDAKEASYNGAKWVASQAIRRRFEGTSVVLDVISNWELPVEEGPESFATAKKQTEEMNARELKEYIARHKREGLDATRYIVDLQFKYAFPLVALIMAALAVPFGIRTARQSGLAASVGASVILGVGAWLVLALFISLGHSGILPPVISAWGMHIIFGVSAIYLWMRMPA